MKNSNERMIELYQEAIDGHKHEWEEELEWETKWHDKVAFQFMSQLNYRIKKDKIEEAAKMASEHYGFHDNKPHLNFKHGFIQGAQWYRDNNND